VTPVEDIVEDLVDLQAAQRESRSQHIRRRLERVVQRRTREQRTIPKRRAANMLGVSVPTLDKWIERGQIAVVTNPRNGRELVAIVPFARLLAEVRSLRKLGESKGLLAAAIADLERNDPDYQAQFAALYGKSLDALRRGDLKPVEVPPTFGPDD
jgi:hypothetical protein